MKNLFLVLIIILSFVILPQKASAHFLAVDKTISAYLHIDPNDDPVAGEQSMLFFDLHDESKKFLLQRCDCNVVIKENGKTIFSHRLEANKIKTSIGTGSVSYMFPKIDVYQIQIIGKPHVQNTFQPFMLDWDFRVNHEVSSPHTSTKSLSLPYLAVGGISLLAIIGYCIKRLS